MSDLERHLESSEGKISEEIDSCIEEYRSYLARCPKTISVDAECTVDFLTKMEVYSIGKKVYSCWETTKTRQKYGEAVETSKVSRLQDSEPTTQSEEAVISFEDAKSEMAKQHVQRYDIEKLIEAELKEIGILRSKDSSSSSEAKPEKKSDVVESMDFSEMEKKAADIPGIADLEFSKKAKRTDILEVLLRLYESLSVDSTEGAATYLAGSDAFQMGEVKEFRKHLADEMKIIYERLVRINPCGTHRAPENVDTSDSSSSNKDSSSSFSLTPSAILTPSESTSGYPEPTTETVTRGVDDTISSRLLPTMNSDSSASGLINDPVIDMAAAQPKSPESSSSSSESASMSTNTSTVSEENNTLSGISSLPTDPRLSVSSLRDVMDPKTSTTSHKALGARASMSSLKDVYPRSSLSSMKDVYNRSSLTSLKDVDNRSSLSSLRDIDDVLPRQLPSSEDYSDDAFLTAPLVAKAETLPSSVDSDETTQNPRRRGRSSKEDEDKSKAKRPAH